MNDKKSDISRILRARITDGGFRPGDRLPTREALFADFGVSNKTLQRALDTLIAEGYVETRGRAGTFVAQNPPHLARICIVSSESFEAACAENQLYRSIREDLGPLSAELGVRYEILDEALSLSRASAQAQLLEDVRSRRLAGIFFLAPPWAWRNSPIIQAPGIARVVLASRGTPGFDIPFLYPDYADFHRCAMEFLLRRNVRRPAWLLDEISAGRLYESLRVKAQEHWPHRACDWQSAGGKSRPVLLENLLELMFDRPLGERPDALVLCDDNLLPRLSAKLHAIGMTDDFTLLSMANFPFPTDSALPVFRIGFDTKEILRIATRTILRQVAGETVPGQYLLPAEYETSTP